MRGLSIIASVKGNRTNRTKKTGETKMSITLNDYCSKQENAEYGGTLEDCIYDEMQSNYEETCKAINETIKEMRDEVKYIPTINKM